MKTILWATLTANGNYARSTPAHPPKPQALADFATQVAAHGNFIVGRQTFQEFQAQRSDERPGSTFATADVVVVSGSLQMPGVTCVKTPEAALVHLRERGHKRALIAGGERLHNAFLAAGLVDELIIDMAPALEGEGLRIVLPKGQHRDLHLLASKVLGGGVLQMHYALTAR